MIQPDFRSASVGIRPPEVTMVQPSESRIRAYATGGDRGSSAARCSPPQSKMGAVFVVVGNLRAEQPLQLAFIDRDDVIQQVAPATADPAFGDAILPRAPERGSDRPHFERLNS
jgi:hypothetical protein